MYEMLFKLLQLECTGRTTVSSAQEFNELKAVIESNSGYIVRKCADQKHCEKVVK